MDDTTLSQAVAAATRDMQRSVERAFDRAAEVMDGCNLEDADSFEAVRALFRSKFADVIEDAAKDLRDA